MMSSSTGTCASPLFVIASVLWLAAPSPSASTVVERARCSPELTFGEHLHALQTGVGKAGFLHRVCLRGSGSARAGVNACLGDPALPAQMRLRGGCGDADATNSGMDVGDNGPSVVGSLGAGGGGQGTEELRTGLENLDQIDDDGNQTKTPCNTEGGCPHGRHADNPDEQHCMECEVMAFLQRAANLLQQAGGRIESTIFAEQWTELYPEDPLTPEQVATAVAGILKESGYFHVEETSDHAVKIFELIEQAEDAVGIGDCPQTICLPFELSPPEQDDFLDAARAWLATTGVGRHPAVGSGRMTHDELAGMLDVCVCV